MGLVSIQNTNFENGITNRNAADLFGSMGHLDPTKFITYWDDFHAPVIISGDLGGFNASLTGSVLAVTSEAGGAIRIATGGTDTNVNIIRTLSEGFSTVASRRLYFRTRLETADVIDADVLMGLTDESNDITPVDAIFFHKADGAATVDLVVRRSSSEIARAVNVFTMVNGVMATFEFAFDGIDRVYFGINGTPQGFVTLSALPVGQMAPMLGAITGATAVKTVDIDFLFASQER